MVNLTTGEEFTNVLVIVVFATVMGIIFGVIYTLSGNLWACILLHSLYDFLAFLNDSLETGPDWPVYTEIVLFAVVAIIYLVMLSRQSEKASALWKAKWSQTDAPAEIPAGPTEA